MNYREKYISAVCYIHSDSTGWIWETRIRPVRATPTPQELSHHTSSTWYKLYICTAQAMLYTCTAHAMLYTCTKQHASAMQMRLCWDRAYFREAQNCRDKKNWFSFLLFTVWMVNFVQSSRFRAAINFFFGITAFWYQNQNPGDQMGDGRQFCASLNTEFTCMSSNRYADMHTKWWSTPRR